jgi:hypothetical protein
MEVTVSLREEEIGNHLLSCEVSPIGLTRHRARISARPADHLRLRHSNGAHAFSLCGLLVGPSS